MVYAKIADAAGGYGENWDNLHGSYNQKNRHAAVFNNSILNIY